MLAIYSPVLAILGHALSLSCNADESGWPGDERHIVGVQAATTLAQTAFDLGCVQLTKKSFRRVVFRQLLSRNHNDCK